MLDLLRGGLLTPDTVALIAESSKRRGLEAHEVTHLLGKQPRRVHGGNQELGIGQASIFLPAETIEPARAGARAEAEAKAFGISAMMQAFAAAAPKILQALASVGMQPGQLMAQAFRELADNAGKIGHNLLRRSPYPS